MYTADYAALPDGGVAFTILGGEGNAVLYQPHNPYTDGGFPVMTRKKAETAAARMIAALEESAALAAEPPASGPSLEEQVRALTGQVESLTLELSAQKAALSAVKSQGGESL